MIELSYFMMVMDIGWTQLLWGLFWFFAIMGLYTSLIIGYSRAAARQEFIKNTMPNLYNGKLKIAQEELKTLKEEKKKSRHENQNNVDTIRAVRNLMDEN